MRTALHGQIPNREDTALSAVLGSFAAAAPWDDVRVAVAYASVAGLLHFLDVLEARRRSRYTSQWLFGLDDYLTQPGVLRTCLSIPNAEVRTARLQTQGCRFHPKLLIVSQNHTRSLACVGSSNLTLGGMRRNCEAFAAITATTAEESAQFSRTWGSIWQLGHATTIEDIDAYEADYSQRSPKWPDRDDIPQAEPSEEAQAGSESRILTNDSAALDPSLARTCWIEVGKNTAKGHELEFKAEQALFFGLSPSGSGDHKEFRQFVASSGETVTLPLRYQENGMWRLQMNSNIPEVAVGLRPRDRRTGQLGRSPHVAVFTRTEDRQTYFLRFIRDDSTEYADLRREFDRDQW